MSDKPICPLLEEFLARRRANIIAECLRGLADDLPDMIREQAERKANGKANR
jgi:hypothetical protein